MSARGSASARVALALSLGVAACGESAHYYTPPQGDIGSVDLGGAGAGGVTPSGAGGSLGPFAGIERSERAAPLVGGTLIVTRDGGTAVAADPDRDRVFLINLHDLSVAAIETPLESVPGRLVEGVAGSVFVVAQGSGSLLAVDVPNKAITWQVPVCGAPRALDYDAASDAVYVACRSGMVAVVSARDGAVLKRLQFDDDLVDILVQGKSLVLARRRRAELLLVDADGTIQRGSPDASPNIASNGFRIRPLPSGAILASHVIGTVDGHVEPSSQLLPVDGTAPSISVTPSRFSSVAGATSNDPLDRALVPELSFDPHPFARSIGPFDIAVSPSGNRFALLSLGDAWYRGTGPLYTGPIDSGTGRVTEDFWSVATGNGFLDQRVAGEPIAIAFDAKNRLLVQSREPAALVLENGVLVALSEESRADTGLALFYANLGRGRACATCHPAGGDDGRGWLPSGTMALARTQSLEGGTVTQGPYFRDGRESELDSAVHWMFGDFPPGFGIEATDENIEALSQWMSTLPKPPPPDDLDVDAAARGRAVFAQEGCARCHSGKFWSDATPHDVGTGGTFVTSKLAGLPGRAPYFHDGCALSLVDLFGLCGGGPEHRRTLAAAARADLVEFLRSL